MATKMRAKFYITSVEPVTPVQERIKMSAVGKSGAYSEDGSDEDNTYAKFSPSASLEIDIMNPALMGQFKTGDKMYVDFTPVEEA